MVKDITMVSSTPLNSVRLVKITDFLYSKNIALSFLGWKRHKGIEYDTKKYVDVHYVLKGGGEGNKWLPLFYLLFIFRLIIFLLFHKKINKTVFYVVGFECAYPLYIASLFRDVTYIYDIWDEFAISHNFPSFLKRILRSYDKKVRKRAAFYIHVDESRVSEIDSENYIIIYNSPVDVFKDYNEEERKYKNQFAVTGWLNKTRGLNSIYEFALNNKDIKFIVAGEFLQNEMEEKFKSLENVVYHHFMPQKELFELIRDCRGIFSLYDPSIEINRLAASNKLYDSMMLSIPVIVNDGILAADMVKKEKIGYVVNYEFDESWQSLAEFDLEKVKCMGERGRSIYLGKFEFNDMLEKRLLPVLYNLL